MVRGLSLLLCIVGVLLPAAADPFSPGAVGLPGGLSQSTVTAVAQGPEGFLWIGTPGGLNRYDGYEIRVYHNGDANLGDDDITALHLDASATLWVATRYSGLYRYDPRARDFTRMLSAVDLSHAWITALTHDASGTIWVGTDSAGLFALDPATGESRRWPYDPVSSLSIGSPGISALAADRRGNLYAATPDRGLTVIAAGGRRVSVHRREVGRSDSLPSDRITSLLVDRSDTLWIATAEGAIGRFSPDGRSYTPVLREEPTVSTRSRVNALIAGSRDDLWAAAGDGVVRVRDDVVVDRFDYGATVRALLEDRSGVIWIGTHAAGMGRYVPRNEQFAGYLGSADDATERSLVWSIGEDADGTIWIGTERSGVVRYTPSTDRPVRLPGTDDAPVHGLHPGSTLWLALGRGGAREVDSEGRELRRIAGGGPAGGGPAVLSVHADEQRVYLGTAGDGLYVVDRDNAVLRYPTEVVTAGGRRAGRSVYAIVEAGGGQVWLGTDHGSIVRFDAQTGNLERFALFDDPRPGVVIWSIDPDASGRLWLACRDGGAVLFHPDRGVQLRLEPRVDLPADLVYGVVADRAGGVWITTNAGLLRLDERSGELQRYTSGDGVQANEFSSGAVVRASDGTIYAGGVNGLTRFDPLSTRPSSYVAPVVISGLIVANRPEVRWSDLAYADAPAEAADGRSARPPVPRLTLSPKERGVTVTVASLDYSDPTANLYAHRLVGLDDVWSEPSPDRVIRYAGLRPGDYRLHVRATNGDGVWNRTGMALDITVVPPFWQTEWFVALSILLSLAVVFVLVYARLRSVASSRIELERIVALRTADLAASRKALQREIRVRSRAERSLHDVQDRIDAQRENRALLQEVHHRVKNNLQVISSLLSLQGSQVSDESARHGFLVSRQRIDAMALIHDQLYRGGDLAAVDMSDYFESLVSSLRSLHGRSFPVETRVDAGPLDITRATPCGLITNELVTNAMKHAFPGESSGEPPRIVIEFVEEDGSCRLVVADNGVGMAADARDGASPTLGLQIVEVLALQLGGTLSVRTGARSRLGSGTEFTIRF